jgi:hypothetical protein
LDLVLEKGRDGGGHREVGLSVPAGPIPKTTGADWMAEVELLADGLRDDAAAVCRDDERLGEERAELVSSPRAKASRNLAKSGWRRARP